MNSISSTNSAACKIMSRRQALALSSAAVIGVALPWPTSLDGRHSKAWVIPANFVVHVGGRRMEFTPDGLKIDGQRVPLPGKEYPLVELLAFRRGETFSTTALHEYLFGATDDRESRVVHIFVSHARKIMMAATSHNFIETIWGKGYRLAEPTGDV